MIKLLKALILFMFMSCGALAGPSSVEGLPIKRDPRINPDILAGLAPDFTIKLNGAVKLDTTKTGATHRVQPVIISNIGRMKSPSVVPIKVYLYACVNEKEIPCKTVIPECHATHWENSWAPLKPGTLEEHRLDVDLPCAMKLGMWTHIQISVNASGGATPAITKEANFSNNSAPETFYAPE